MRIRGLALAMLTAGFAVATAEAASGSVHRPSRAAAKVTATGAAPVLPLGHAGRWITDRAGRVWVTHGTNMVYKVPPYYPSAAPFGPRDAAFLRSIGFNSVRVGVIWKALEPTPGVYNAAYVTAIARTVKMLAGYGIVSLLDFHQDMLSERFQGEGFPDWAIEDGGLPNPQLGFSNNYLANPALEHALDQFFQNAPGPNRVGLQTSYGRAWADVARAFRSNPSVLGYELMNEPFPGTAWEPCAALTGCPQFDSELFALYRRLIAAIRPADPRGLVWYEPNVVFNDGPDTTLGPLGDPHAGFAFHDYCLTEPESLTDSDPASCQKLDDLVFQHALAHVASTHDALLMTEFGATLSTSYLDDMIDRADRNMVSWEQWAYCGCRDPTTQGPGDTQALVKDTSKPPAGSNLVTTTLDAIVEPYPQLVAGTPLGWAYNRSTRAFTVRYTTAPAGGGRRFGLGAETVLSTPRLDYPHGYGARVSGAAIVSKRNAGSLVLAACRGAKTISVAIGPSGRNRGSCRAPRVPVRR